ncbi:hypothetical protein MMC07_009136 [Pseudocyphellaria aurata]|nr:hypothetical protein [Pseudocyphellaria aurata]
MLKQAIKTRKAVGVPSPRKTRSETRRAGSVVETAAAAATKAPASSANQSVVVAPLEHEAEENIAMRSAAAAAAAKALTFTFPFNRGVVIKTEPEEDEAGNASPRRQKANFQDPQIDWCGRHADEELEDNVKSFLTILAVQTTHADFAAFYPVVARSEEQLVDLIGTWVVAHPNVVLDGLRCGPRVFLLDTRERFNYSSQETAVPKKGRHGRDQPPRKKEKAEPMDQVKESAIFKYRKQRGKPPRKKARAESPARPHSNDGDDTDDTDFGSVKIADSHTTDENNDVRAGEVTFPSQTAAAAAAEAPTSSSAHPSAHPVAANHEAEEILVEIWTTIFILAAAAVVFSSLNPIAKFPRRFFWVPENASTAPVKKRRVKQTKGKIIDDDNSEENGGKSWSHFNIQVDDGQGSAPLRGGSAIPLKASEAEKRKDQEPAVAAAIQCGLRHFRRKRRAEADKPHSDDGNDTDDTDFGSMKIVNSHTSDENNNVRAGEVLPPSRIAAAAAAKASTSSPANPVAVKPRNEKDSAGVVARFDDEAEEILAETQTIPENASATPAEKRRMKKTKSKITDDDNFEEDGGKSWSHFEPQAGSASGEREQKNLGTELSALPQCKAEEPQAGPEAAAVDREPGAAAGVSERQRASTALPASPKSKERALRLLSGNGARH